jgi:alkylation response protein AidB-like acyl-CoA dehydrogenase
VGGGWGVAMGTLAFERGASTLGQQLNFRNELDAIAAAARRSGRVDEPVLRQRLAEAHIGLEIMRLNALRTLAGSEAGALRPEALIGKLYWATFHRALGELAMDVLGAGAMATEDSALQRLFLFSRADTIYAGSNEIQRDIIGERALGLPREPR